MCQQNPACQYFSFFFFREQKHFPWCLRIYLKPFKKRQFDIFDCHPLGPLPIDFFFFGFKFEVLCQRDLGTSPDLRRQATQTLDWLWDRPFHLKHFQVSASERRNSQRGHICRTMRRENGKTESIATPNIWSTASHSVRYWKTLIMRLYFIGYISTCTPVLETDTTTQQMLRQKVESGCKKCCFFYHLKTSSRFNLIKSSLSARFFICA